MPGLIIIGRWYSYKKYPVKYAPKKILRHNNLIYLASRRCQRIDVINCVRFVGRGPSRLALRLD